MKNVWEVLVVVGIVIVLAIFFLPFFTPRSPPRAFAPRSACAENLAMIAKACNSYQQNNEGDFLPAFWDGARFDPMKSLALLYPYYLPSARAFPCPNTSDQPEIKIAERVENNNRYSFGPVDTSKKCSYFYDELTNPRKIGPNQAIACDADGQTWRDASGKPPPYPANWTRKPRKPNHDNGQNVMYFDGHVKWTETVYSSADPRDNIFCPTGDASGPWDADTDACLWDGVNARPIEMVK